MRTIKLKNDFLKPRVLFACFCCPFFSFSKLNCCGGGAILAETHYYYSIKFAQTLTITNYTTTIYTTTNSKGEPSIFSAPQNNLSVATSCLGKLRLPHMSLTPLAPPNVAHSIFMLCNSPSTTTTSSLSAPSIFVSRINTSSMNNLAWSSVAAAAELTFST